MQRRLARRALHTNTTSRRRRRRRKERARDLCLSGFFFFCSWSETWQLRNRCGTPKISNVFFFPKDANSFSGFQKNQLNMCWNRNSFVSIPRAERWDLGLGFHTQSFQSFGFAFLSSYVYIYLFIHSVMAYKSGRIWSKGISQNPNLSVLQF